MINGTAYRYIAPLGSLRGIEAQFERSMSALKSHGHITDTFTRIEIRNDHAFTLLFYYNINIHNLNQIKLIILIYIYLKNELSTFTYC